MAVDIPTIQGASCVKCADAQESAEHFQRMEKAADDARGILAVGVLRILQQIEDRRHVAESVAADPDAFKGTTEAETMPVTVEEIEKSLKRIHANARRAWKNAIRGNA